MTSPAPPRGSRRVVTRPDGAQRPYRRARWLRRRPPRSNTLGGTRRTRQVCRALPLPPNPLNTVARPSPRSRALMSRNQARRSMGAGEPTDALPSELGSTSTMRAGYLLALRSGSGGVAALRTGRAREGSPVGGQLASTSTGARLAGGIARGASRYTQRGRCRRRVLSRSARFETEIWQFLDCTSRGIHYDRGLESMCAAARVVGLRECAYRALPFTSPHGGHEGEALLCLAELRLGTHSPGDE